MRDERIGRSLRGNVDRNDLSDSVSVHSFCRSLRGNVDRNIVIISVKP